MLTGQLHSAGAGHRSRKRCYTAILLFAVFSILPDADLIPVALGAHDWGAIGHRGASHSLVTALMVGLACGLFARRMGVPALRTAFAITVAVGSHGLLDTLGEGGRGIPLLWPFSSHRFMSPWRVLPDAPRVEDYLSRAGIISLLSEFGYFLPLMVYVLWPRKRSGAKTTAMTEAAPAEAATAEAATATVETAMPPLTMVRGGRLDTPPLGVRAVASDTQPGEVRSADASRVDDPPLRSSG
jgi:inner membrane protein